MITGIYQSAAGLDCLSQIQDMVSNNLANVSTNGFKQEMANVEKTGDGRVLYERRFDFKSGSLEMTGQPLDVAIKQAGFFVVETATGPAYTRNGNFTLDAEGKLVTAAGWPVQGEKGAIILGSQKVTLSDKGEFMAGNEVVDRLQIIKAPQDLKPLGNALFVSDEPIEPLAAEEVDVLPGALERSNADLTRSMVDMLEVVRLYEANQKALQSQDEALKLVVSQVGRSA